jgi:hypothetical protein
MRRCHAARVFNVCPRCGTYSEEKEIDPSGPFAICPQCGYRHRFVRLPLFVVTGASGAGKTSTALRLAALVQDYVCIDADILWRPEFDTPADGYRAFRNLSLRVAKTISQAGRPVILLEGGIPEQFETCPERRYFSTLHYLALVCDDAVLVRRLTARPRWRRSATASSIERERSFNAWLWANGAKTTPRMTLLDTTSILEDDTASRLADWLRSVDARRRTG